MRDIALDVHILDDEEWLSLWTRRFGDSAVHALAEELRRLPWRLARD